jgi:hypothetical protein
LRCGAKALASRSSNGLPEHDYVDSGTVSFISFTHTPF